MLHHFLWGHASVYNVLLIDFNNGIFSYPVDDEVLRSFKRAVKRFEGGKFPLPLLSFDRSYCCYCIVWGGIVGIDVNGWIVRPSVVTNDSMILLHRDDGEEVSIGAYLLEVVGL